MGEADRDGRDAHHSAAALAAVEFSVERPAISRLQRRKTRPARSAARIQFAAAEQRRARNALRKAESLVLRDEPVQIALVDTADVLRRRRTAVPPLRREQPVRREQRHLRVVGDERLPVRRGIARDAAVAVPEKDGIHFHEFHGIAERIPRPQTGLRAGREKIFVTAYFLLTYFPF